MLSFAEAARMARTANDEDEICPPPANLRGASLSLVEEAIADGEWHYATDIVAASGLSIKTVYKTLDILDERGVIEIDDHAHRWRYRLLPPGAVAPLYHSAMDARPLAAVFGGYTFPQEGQTPWHR